MVMTRRADPDTQHDEEVAAVWRILGLIPDPEIPAISVVDLGVVRSVEMDDDRLTIEILPTFVGCPAVEMMRTAIAGPVGRHPTLGGGARHVRSAMDERPDHPARSRAARRGRLCSARAGERRGARPSGHHPPRAATPLPVLRRPPDPAGQRVRADPVPVASRTAWTAASRSSSSRRSDRGVSRRDLGVVAIVGAGTMGAGIAEVALAAGHPVRLFDTDPSAVERARIRIGEGLVRTATRAGADPDSAGVTAADALSRLTAVADLRAVATEAELVIEAAVEALEPKRRIFEVLDRAASPATILATNTSALSVTAIAAGTDDPARVLGLHFFNPAPRMALVEVVRTAMTAPLAMQRATERMSAWGKTPVRCSDSPGFIVNRVNRPFTLEALALLGSDAASVPRIDGALRAAGFPMGPFELMDLIGIDVNLAAARGLYEAMDRRPRFEPSPIQERLVAAGRLGRKTGAGFYRYDGSGRSLGPVPDTEGLDDDRMTGAEIAERVVLAIVNEAFSALGDGVATEPDIDLAMRLGAGHPIGPFERVESLGGPRAIADRLRDLQSTAGPRFVPSALLADVR